MKLPDFLSFSPFNQLRKSMGATSLGSFSLVVSVSSTTYEETKLLEGRGVEIDSLDSIYELEDGTLAFKDTRVLLYIRDVNVSSGRYSQTKTLPKFHVSWCSTLKKMKANRRFDRYVLSTRTDGVFEIRKTGKYSASTVSSNEPLDVCKNCLDKLNYQGYRNGAGWDNNKKVFEKFSLRDFFGIYPKSPLNSKPKPRYTNATAPTDIYPDNFREISTRYREQVGWICEECGVNLSSQSLRRFLHTHHLSGRKHDNNESNLKALCIICHANQADHGQLKSTPDYSKFYTMKNGV